jgi:hypothetical protein
MHRGMKVYLNTLKASSLDLKFNAVDEGLIFLD